LSQFSRRARWLNQLFTSSVAPQVSDPSQVSDDVSLVQPYDGGGIAIAIPTFPPLHDSGVDGPLLFTEPFVGIIDFKSGVGITVQTDIFQLPDTLVARLLSVGLTTLAGSGAEQVSLNATPHNQSGLSDHQCQYSEEMDTTINASPRKFQNVPPILLPGLQLNMFFNSGSVLSFQHITFAMIIAPTGTVFRI